MSDLVEWLRSRCNCGLMKANGRVPPCGNCKAADEIERLKAEVKRYRDATTEDAIYRYLWKNTNTPSLGTTDEHRVWASAIASAIAQITSPASDKLNREVSSTARASGCGPEDGGSIPPPPSTDNTGQKE